MLKTQLFSGYQFILVPNSTTKMAVFRKKLLKQNGATIKFNLQNIDNALGCYIVIEDGITVDKLVLIKSLNLKDMSMHDDLVIKYPIVQTEWITTSLLKKKLLPVKNFLYEIDGVLIDEKLELPVKKSRKRLVEFEKTEQMSKKLKIEELDGDDDEEEEEHANSKQLLSSKRQLLLLNSEIGSDNSNQLIIDYFNKMAEEYKKNGESFKYVNYKKAINTISNLDHKLTSYDEAIKLPNIGKRLALKIEQINSTGTLSQLDDLQNDPKLQTLQAFTSIYGVGQTTAKNWYDEGLRSVEDISKLPILSENQKLGIKYYKDWNEKIPRDEVTKHVDYITNVLKKLDPRLELLCTGSYRRGLKQCGDVDFLLMKKNCNDTSELSLLLYHLIQDLKSSDYIKCSLVRLTTKMRKFYGGGQLLGHEFCRRIDFLTVPWIRRGSYLLYFTGNDILNRSIRQLAADKGLHLNEKGLFKNYNTKQQELIESFDELLIFEKLGVNYKRPEDRNLGNFTDF